MDWIPVASFAVDAVTLLVTIGLAFGLRRWEHRDSVRRRQYDSERQFGSVLLEATVFMRLNQPIPEPKLLEIASTMETVDAEQIPNLQAALDAAAKVVDWPVDSEQFDPDITSFDREARRTQAQEATDAVLGFIRLPRI